MITDQQSNFLYLSEWLPEYHPIFYQEFEKILQAHNISYVLLKHTNDIWAVDFMPIQIEKDKFVQFVYKPDYLVNNKKNHKYITDASLACEAIDIYPMKSDIILDGGNLIRTKDKVLMTEKVFKENKQLSKKEVKKQLKEAFEVDNLFFVPFETDDKIGHIDGMIRFIDDNTVLINDYYFDKSSFPRSLKAALRKAKLDWVVLPYSPVYDTKSHSAKGFYINYLQMSQCIIMPTFNSTYDDEAYKVLQHVFKGKKIVTVDSKEVAKEGGVLNCITWNVFK